MKCRWLVLLSLFALPVWATPKAQKPAKISTPAPEIVLQTSHQRPVAAVRYSSDGRWAASVSHVNVFADLRGELKLWDMSTSVISRTFTGTPSRVNDCAFTPDNKTLIVAGDKRGLTLWDVVSGRYLGLIITPGESGSLYFTPDGHKLIVADGTGLYLSGVIRVYDWNTRKWERTFGSRNPGTPGMAQTLQARHDFGVTNDSRQVWVRNRHHLKWWDITTGQEVRSWPLEETLAIPHSDGQRVAVVFNDYQPKLQLWDTDKKVLWLTSLTDLSTRRLYSPTFLEFSPDGKQILVPASQEGYIAIIDAANGQLKKEWQVSFHPVQLISFSPNGRTAAIGSRIYNQLFWARWPETSLSASTTVPPSPPLQLDLPRDGHSAYWKMLDVLLKWNLKTGMPRRVPRLQFTGDTPPGVHEYRFSPDGKTLYGQTDEFLQAFSTETGRSLWKHTLQGDNRQKAWISISISPDGRTLATTREDHTLQLIRASDGKFLTPDIPIGELPFSRQVIFSPDNRYLAMSGKGHEDPKQRLAIRIFDVKQRKVIRALNGSWGNPVRFSPDGSRLLALQVLQFQVLDTQTGKSLWTAPRNTGVDFLDSKRLLCREDDGYFRIRSASNGTVLSAWPANDPLKSDSTFTVQVLPDDQAITQTRSGTITLWNIAQKRPLLTFAPIQMNERGTLDWLAFTPDFTYQGSPKIEQFFKWRVGDKLLPGTAFKAKNQPAKIKQALQ